MKNNNLPADIVYTVGFILTLLTAPLAGAVLAAESPSTFLEFPPTTEKAGHPEFSWSVFSLMLTFIIITTGPFWKRLIKGEWSIREKQIRQSFPWWGWLAAVGLIVFWILAWNRFPWMGLFQRFTFFPLWFCFIIILNAIAVKWTGRSMMTAHPVYFGMLFPASIAFWWLFEYLNRFVKNWYYIEVIELGGWQYFWEASLAFSTVLPAVMSVLYLLLQISVFRKEFDNFPTAPWLTSKFVWIILGFLSVLGLVGLGWIPELTYPLLWIAPGILWITFQRLKGTLNPVLDKAGKGDLTLVWGSAIAALICGFFWEMWNMYSEAKWLYDVPGVERFYLFEMPILGYAGYLPFGVICLIISYSLFVMLTGKTWIMVKNVF